MPTNGETVAVVLIDGVDKGTTDRGSAGGSIARIYRVSFNTLSSGPFRSRKRTELNKGNIKLDLASVESSDDLVIRPADESSGRNDGSQSHGSAG